MGTRHILSSVRIFLTSFMLLLLFSFTPAVPSAQSATIAHATSNMQTQTLSHAV